MTARACPRCGDFAASFSGPLCSECVEPLPARRYPWLGKYPPLPRALVGLSFVVIPIVGAMLAFSSRGLPTDAALIGPLALVVGFELAVEEILLPMLIPSYVRRTLAEHGVPDVGLVHHVVRNEGLRATDAGALVVRDDGFVFCGRCGTRLSYPFSDVEKVERVPLLSIRITLHGGSTLRFVIAEGTFRQRKRLEALCARIEAGAAAAG